MLKPPTVPWRYRLAALTVALMIGLSTLWIYQFGAKFAHAVTVYAQMAAQQAAQQAAQKHKPAAPDMKNEPGVVPVAIIPQPQNDQKKN